MQNWLLTWCNSLSYHQNCPAKDCLSQRTFLGGTKSSDVIKLLRWLFNQAKTGDWESYKIDLTCYNKEIKKAKWSSLGDYFLGTEDLPDKVKLMRIMASQSAVLHYLMADIHKLERKPGRKFTEFIFQDPRWVK